MIRFLLYIVAGWIGYRFLKGLFYSDESRSNVHGTKKESDLNLDKEDVEDAKFKDIDNRN